MLFASSSSSRHDDDDSFSLLLWTFVALEWRGATLFFPWEKKKGKGEKWLIFSIIFLRRIFFFVVVVVQSTLFEGIDAPTDTQSSPRTTRAGAVPSSSFLRRRRRSSLRFSSFGKYKGEGFDNTVVPRYHIPPQIKKKIEIFDT